MSMIYEKCITLAALRFYARALESEFNSRLAINEALVEVETLATDMHIYPDPTPEYVNTIADSLSSESSDISSVLETQCATQQGRKNLGIKLADVLRRSGENASEHPFTRQLRIASNCTDLWPDWARRSTDHDQSNS